MAQVEYPSFNIEWRDSGREPQCEPNPAYPEGIDLDLTDGAARWCKADLPYPAKRIGVYFIECRHCGIRVGVTTAGRPDDPTSAKIPCKAAATGATQEGGRDD